MIAETSLRAIIPVMRVTEMTRSVAFYEATLGFKKEWEHQFEPGLPRFACLSCNGMRIYLTEFTQAPPKSQLYAAVADIARVAEAVEAAGGLVVSAPQMQPYGIVEMVMTDPDGNELRVGMQ